MQPWLRASASSGSSRRPVRGPSHRSRFILHLHSNAMYHTRKYICKNTYAHHVTYYTPSWQKVNYQNDKINQSKVRTRYAVG